MKNKIFILVFLSLATCCEGEVTKSESADLYIPLSELFMCQLNLDQAAVYASMDDSCLKPIASGDVVIYRNENVWHFGIFIEKNNENCTVAYSRDPNLTKLVKEEDIRQLYPFWRILYQGAGLNLSPGGFFNLIHEQLNKFPDRNPYLLGKTVNPYSKIVIIGDVHGDFDSLARNLVRLCFDHQIINLDGKLSSDTMIVFLGDYADRGSYGCEVWYSLMGYMKENADKFILLRGNHETKKFSQLDKYYKSLHKDWVITFGSEATEEKWPLMLQMFETLPNGLLFALQTPQTHYFDLILCTHGGVPKVWNPKSIINSTIKSKDFVQTSIDQNLSNAFLNNDFIGEVVTGKKNVRLHKEGEVITLRDLRGFLRSINATDLDWKKENQYCLRAVMRGHQHAAGGIVQLIGTPESWKPLHSKLLYEVDQYSVYSFTSCPQYYGKQDAFGILSIAPNGRWYLRPYIFKAP